MYCELSDVQSIIKWITFGPTSKVTSTEVVVKFIPEADAYIDDKLSRIYVVPVTDATDVKTLRYISMRLAAAEIAYALVLQAAGESPKIIEQWRSDALERLQQVLDSIITLDNTSKVVSSSGLYSFTAHSSDAIEATWKLGEDQW